MILLQSLPNIFTPLKYTRIHDFMEHGFNLTTDDRFPVFDISFSPWVRTLCDWWEDPKTPWIFLVCGSQLAKTSFLMGAFLYVSQYVRGAVPVMWTLNTEDMCKEFIKTRFRPFLDNAGQNAIQRENWKQEYFRVFNASVKVAYASTKDSLRSKPCRYLFGDEIGRWKETVDYVKKRSRTFENKRKGVFATTPPDNEEHHSVKAYTAGNYYQWFVPCPHCGKFQPLVFANIRFEGRDSEKEEYDFNRIMESAHYVCAFCRGKWYENEKLSIVQKGKPVCVDPISFQEVEEKNSDTKTLQISSLYSVFTKWGTVAIEFIKAKSKGSVEALKIFYTDELGEVFRRLGRTIKKDALTKYVDQGRPSGFLPGYDAYTVGIDLQRWGDAYYTLIGWKSGLKIAGHILEFGQLTWKRELEDGKIETDWSDVEKKFSPYLEHINRICLDSSDGVITQEVYDFDLSRGNPWKALKDSGTQIRKVRWSEIGTRSKKKHVKQVQKGHYYLSIRSEMVKDDIANCLSRDPKSPYSWTFPRGTEETEYFTHIGNEHRTTVTVKGRKVSKWSKKYPNAPQHYFSTLVYATAGMEEFRDKLIRGVTIKQKPIDLNSYEVKKL